MSHRERGEGSVYQRGDGRWVAAIQVEGRRRMAYAQTEKEARAKLRTLREKSAAVPVGRHTLAQLVEAWLNSDTSIKETTRAGYWQYLRLYLLPTLGGARLNQITPDRVQAVLAPLTPSNAYKSHLVLHRAFTVAIRWKWAVDNPCKGVIRPRYEPKERQMWSADDAQTFLAGIEGHRLAPLFVLLLTTGLRIGEALALTWDDAGLGVAVNVNGTLYRMQGEARIGKPKSRAGKRTVLLPPRAIEALQAQRLRQAAERTRAGDAWTESGFVFTARNGKAMAHGTAAKFLIRACIRLDLPAINLHGLRHLHASLLIANGTPITAVSARLGHSNPSVTMKLYAHSLPGQDAIAAETIERALNVEYPHVAS